MGAVLERMLPERPQERVVHHDQHGTVRAAMIAGDAGARLQVHQPIRGVGRRLHVEDAEPLPDAFFGDQRPHFVFGRARQKAHRFDAPLGQDVLEQIVGAAVERLAVQHHIAGPQEREQRDKDRRHATFEGGGLLGLVPERQAVFEDLQVRIVQAAVDESELLGRRGSRRP